MGDFGESLGKQAVRELWNTPLLRYLHHTYNIRYRYMGLPGVDLLDVRLWKDMIVEVIAFERLAEQVDQVDPGGRRNINELRRNLKLIGLPGYVYFGTIEEVVIRRYDHDGTEYKQDKFIPLYNLDFCDEITSKIDTAQAGKKLLRFEAIRQILADQQECYRQFGGSGLFVILLTIRNQIDATKLRKLLSRNLYSDTHQYLNICSNLNPLPPIGTVLGSHTWALKAFLHNVIRQYLTNPNISAVFFPIVKYMGKTEGSPMLHCMILCRFHEQEEHSPMYYPQNYLTKASIRAQDTQTLVWEPEPGELLIPSMDPNSEEWLRNFEQHILRGRGLRRSRTARIRQ